MTMTIRAPYALPLQHTSLRARSIVQIIQYTIKLLVPFLHFRARIHHITGFRRVPVSLSAARLKKLEGIIGDSRMLWRIWGQYAGSCFSFLS